DRPILENDVSTEAGGDGKPVDQGRRSKHSHTTQAHPARKAGGCLDLLDSLLPLAYNIYQASNGALRGIALIWGQARETVHKIRTNHNSTHLPRMPCFQVG